MEFVKIPIATETLERLNPFRSEDESVDTVINVLLDYIGFHTDEFFGSRS
ncbi:hypothetical protein AAA799E16_00233 [Marine Group I thaumarchaeote SCGC AAA799-E16]|uniref:Uncharacterized protein n=2 Tax=Marine Group I TaxID=905826 RepID=A0A087S188_9ARCH|nr:hypothetical protein AAA799E16_00233 [Marine Group I thaumarchaeote SCGC AAA799-E16]KFM19492.1 hypothetical protein SCCGRSA3_00417 [Marine Group I thaumarchaeote SCGC RSA3]